MTVHPTTPEDQQPKKRPLATLVEAERRIAIRIWNEQQHEKRLLAALERSINQKYT